MRVKVKRVMDEIITVLNREDENAKDLWNILTALRGPDSGHCELKKATTAVLRYNLGLGASHTPHLGYWMQGTAMAVQGTLDLSEIRAELLSVYSDANLHFIQHFESAVQAFLRSE